MPSFSLKKRMQPQVNTQRPVSLSPEVPRAVPQTVTHYMVRSPWEWVMKEVSDDKMVQVDKTAELPSALNMANTSASNGDVDSSVSSLSSSRRRRGTTRKRNIPSTLRLEIIDANDGKVRDAVHGVSAAFDGLEDKDELFRTLQRCRCDHLNLSPPTVLISWDATIEECKNLVGESMPVLPGNQSEVKFAVLKEPMGSQGTGIFFVRDAEEIHQILSEHQKRARGEPELLDRMIDVKGRIPSWVLQAEVNPCCLIQGKFKFHLRSYVVAVENFENESLLDLYVYNRHEVRCAKVSVSEDGANRDSAAHITNGGVSDNAHRWLVSDVPELVTRNTQGRVEIFLAQTFGYHFLPDMTRRVGASAREEERTATSAGVRKFAIAAVDMMLSKDNDIYLLEVNVNPAAPPKEVIETEFKDHLTGFMKNLVDLVTGVSCENFVSVYSIIEQSNQLGEC